MKNTPVLHKRRYLKEKIAAREYLANDTDIKQFIFIQNLLLHTDFSINLDRYLYKFQPLIKTKKMYETRSRR